MGGAHVASPACVTGKFGVMQDFDTASKDSLDPLANSVANAVKTLLGSVLGAFRNITACCRAEGGGPNESMGVKVVRPRGLQYPKRTFGSGVGEVQDIRVAVNVESGDLRTHSPSLGNDLRISICDALGRLTLSS